LFKLTNEKTPFCRKDAIVTTRHLNARKEFIWGSDVPFVQLWKKINNRRGDINNFKKLKYLLFTTIKIIGRNY
jgi:hypothetical protein